MRECLFVAAAIVLLTTPRLWAGSTTTFQLGDQGGVIVPVMLNGNGPFMMLLDTGATHSVITEDVAATGAQSGGEEHCHLAGRRNGPGDRGDRAPAVGSDHSGPRAAVGGARRARSIRTARSRD